MPRIVPQGPWTTELDWNLHATHDGETCTPFHLYVRPRAVHQLARDFPQFSRLPAELQIAIFRHCDSAVLFQLMRVSSKTRREAEKLFWSRHDAWVKIDGTWLLAGGFSGHTYDAIDFLARVRQVEVDFDGSGPLSHNAWVDGVQQYAKRPPDHIRDQQIHRFWQVLQWRFPCADNVILSGISGEDAGLAPPTAFMTMVEQCPRPIRASVSCLQRIPGYPARATRTLWRQTPPGNSQLAAWKAVTLDWRRQTVLPPPKRFSGPVGAFSRIEYYHSLFFYRHFAKRLLLIQATEAYYSHPDRRPCICPVAGCGLLFELPGQWATHMIDAAHDGEISPPGEPFKSLFEDHFARQARIEQQYADEMADLQTKWGEEGSQQRTDAEQAFLTQLQHDPLWTHEKPPAESAIWLRYQQAMCEKS
ncbi:hypothetical protein NX059_012128 [Plenodomus lindquistii]|nr:hypothetical protein NX059_012138 [Plenodomus lindquistii]KAI8930758.1 hypothetical protein NX059_012366 [Plenodomus lindquistii]KAI8931118.1 hypothetical protein NX059_012128 [Plenodomus lindquistii]